MNDECIYLDYHATTPLDRRVFETMEPYLFEHFGNPASALHRYGWKAQAAVNAARRKIAELIGAVDPQEIIFTSGATESINLALKGIALHYGQGSIITVRTEHNAVLDTCRWLQQRGFHVIYLDVDSEGFVDLYQFESSLRPDTIVVSVMHVNNEVGTIQNLAAIGSICQDRGILFHTDATQAIGKIPFDVSELNVDMASFTAHKIYGPKGVGALYIRKKFPRIHLEPIIHGGGHEFGMRSGTLNVPGIVGIATALEVSSTEQPGESRRIGTMRNWLWDSIREIYPSAVINGPDPSTKSQWRIAGNLNISFLGIDSERLISLLTNVAVSTVSACGSGHTHTSHVLNAMGLGEERARSAIRIGLGRFTTYDQLVRAVEYFKQALKEAQQCVVSVS